MRRRRALRAAGARPQRPLWAGTGTKDPAYSDVVYVESPIGPDVVDTMAEATLRAFADHGHGDRVLGADDGAAREALRRAELAGVDLPAITAQLERDGMRSLCASHRDLLRCIDAELA